MTNKNNKHDEFVSGPTHGLIVNKFINDDIEIHKNVDFLKQLVFNAMCSILNEQLGIEYNTIKIDSTIMDDLGADELDIPDIIGTVEESFNIEIPEDYDYKFHMVKDFVDFVTTAKLSEKLGKN